MIKKKTKLKLIFSAVIILSILILSINSTTVIASCKPIQKSYHQMIYDVENDKIILYGGITQPGYHYWTTQTLTYNYNNNTWKILDLAQYPFQKIAFGIAYDSESKKTITYGGEHADAEYSDETWVFDSNENTWVNANPATNPGKRADVRMVYDSESDVIVMWSGSLHRDANPDSDKTIWYEDLWTYDYNANTWTNITPTIMPPHSMNGIAYDSESDRIIHFGGCTSPVGVENIDCYTNLDLYNDETWAYDYNTNTWENVTPAISPEARSGLALAYDSESDRVIMAGGRYHIDQTLYGNETWAYDYNTNTWEQMDVLGTGPFKYGHKIAYDSESDRIILFGGGSEPYDISDETWAYDYNTDTWTQMTYTVSNICKITTTTENSYFIAPFLVSILVASIFVIRRKKKI